MGIILTMLKKILIIVTILVVFLALYFLKFYLKPIPVPDSTNLPTYTAIDLQNFNGTDPAKIILLALDGFVYDVTSGKEFYKIGGAYHDLAGKDSSTELHIAGGDIIKRKYKVVGVYKI